MPDMNAFQHFLADLGVYGGLLLGAPLALIGLAMRGLARRHAARMTLAARARRRIADVSEPGSVAIVGLARVIDGRLLVEDPTTSTRIHVEHEDPTEVREGQSLLVFGHAHAAALGGDVVGTSAYRGDPRAFVVDARGEEHFATPFRREPSEMLPTLRFQAWAGALIFSVGVLLASATSAVAFSLSIQ